MNTDNIKEKIIFVWIPIGIAIGMILTLILQHVTNAKANEITSEIKQSSYVLESIYDSGILTGSDYFVLAYDKYYNPSENPTGTLSVTYPMSAGNWSSWTGTWTTTGFSRTEFSVVQGHIANLDDATRRVYISQDNWVQTLNLKSLNKEDDSVGVLYFDSFNNQDTYGYYAIETFGIQTTDLEVYISNNIIQVQGDAALYKWNNGSWELLSAVISQNVMNMYPVSTVVKSDFLSVKLDSGSSVDIMCSKFSQDTPSEPDEPDEPTTNTPCYSFVYNQGGSFYLIDVFGVPSYDSECNVDSTFTSLAAATNSYNKTFIHPTYFNIKNGYYGGSWLGGYYGPVITFYTTLKSFSHANVYSMGSSYLSNADFVRENFTPSQVANTAEYRVYVNGSYVYYNQGYQLKSLSDGTYLLGLWGISGQYSSVSLRDTYFSGYVTYDYSYSSQVNYINPFASGSSSDNYKPYYQALGHMLGAFENVAPVEPTPSPEPTLPPNVTPTPVPTEPPHVIVQWPTGTPTPTPYPLDFTVPTLPGGDLRPQTTENILSQGLEQIRLHLNTGLLATAFSYVPPELQFLIWFLVFVLLLLAVIKLILHFGG